MSQYIKEEDGTWTKIGGMEKAIDRYLEGEIVVGKWIDGKPIYRKVITHTLSGSLTGLVEIPHGIQNIETPIRVVCGRAKESNTEIGITIPAQYNETTFIYLGAFRETSVQLFAGTESWTTLNSITLCLEYTKTTD